ncbi:MAG: hypothetical protein D6753_13045 [Planctomycetota bacterium]|nr:MAG: hypothetical protein D6753_13045 [Planctomycetota bacterium]
MVPADWDLPDAFRRRLGRSAGRQRLMEHEGQLLIVAHDVPAFGEDRRRGILFWLDAAKTWHCSIDSSGQSGIDRLLERYAARLDELDVAENRAHTADEYLKVLESLAPVARAITNLYGVLQDARKSRPDVPELIDWRDQAYELTRTAELTYQYAKDALEVALVRRAEEQAVASRGMSVAAHRLNVLAALFFPLATLAAIFGTTLTDNWPWSQSPVPFLVFLFGGTIAGILLALFIGVQSSAPNHRKPS